MTDVVLTTDAFQRTFQNTGMPAEIWIKKNEDLQKKWRGNYFKIMAVDGKGKGIKDIPEFQGMLCNVPLEAGRAAGFAV